MTVHCLVYLKLIIILIQKHNNCIDHIFILFSDVIRVMEPGKVQNKTGADGIQKKLIKITIEDIE